MDCHAGLKSVILSIMVATLLPSGLCATDIELHVAPDGNDAWSGRHARPTALDGPLATLDGARNALRKARSGGRIAGPARIIVAGGRYEIAGPLVLSPEDSGCSDATVTYEAAPGARPEFSGGHPALPRR